MGHIKRTAEEYIVLSISGASTICIFPFLIIRLIHGDWGIALLDLFAVVSTSALFTYVYLTSRARVASIIQAFLCVAVVLGTIVIKGPQQTVWLYPSIIGIFFLLTPKIALTTTCVLTLVIGLFLSQSIDTISLVQFSFSTLITILFSFAFSDRMLRQQQMLRELSTKDPLTGAGNRRALEEHLLGLSNNPQTSSQIRPSLILLDLDEFKQINDRYGHSVGDYILSAFCDKVETLLNQHNSIYRYGGEEFVIICTLLDKQAAALLAEDIREMIDNHVFEQDIKLTLSSGIAEYHPPETGFEWLGRADKALYKAKAAGRNLCCVSA